MTTSAAAAIKGLSRPAAVFRAVVLAAALACVGLCVGVAGAQAAPKGVVAVFGQPGSLEGEFSSPAGVAVNSTSGDVYVVDTFNERVQQFDPDGVFIRAWGGGVVDGTDEHQVCTSNCGPGMAGSGAGVFSFGGNYSGIAVAPDGSVYVADTANNRVQQFDADGNFVRMWGWGVETGAEALEVCTASCQPGLTGAGDGQFSSPIGVGIDPNDGDVLVADRDNGRVQRFDAAGGYESQFAVADATPQRVAVDSAGDIYVLRFFNGVQKFDASGALIDGDFHIDVNRLPQDLAVDVATEHVFVAQFTSDFDAVEILEFDSSGGLVETHPVRAGFFESPGLAVNASTGRMYLADLYSSRVFILDEPRHTVSEQPATDVGTNSAMLHGTVNPQNGFAVGYHFEVSGDGGNTWTSFPETDVAVGSGGDDIPVSAEATGLQSNLHYLVRLVATNEFGARVISTGTQGDFTTAPLPPAVTTGPATQITSTSALLTGDINTNNAQTTYRFEWGNTTAYGNSIPVPDGNAGAAGTTITVTDQLDGLLPDTVYHYRLVASNVAGDDEGEDRTFRTRPTPPNAEPRGYELVSPADKVGGVGVGHWYGGPDAVGLVGIAAQDGERFAVRGQQGSTIADDGAFAYVNDWVFAERTSAGWVHRPGVSRRPHAQQPTTDISLSGAAPDLSVTGWGSAQYLKLFPEMSDWAEINGTALMLRRWADPEWEIFGPTVSEYLDQETPGRESSSVGEGPKAFAADGSAVVVSMPDTRGLAGPNDPTRFEFPDRDDRASSVYLDEITGPFSDTFPGDDGRRELLNVCTGADASRTVLPSGPCAPDPTVSSPRSRLTHSGGASLSVGGVEPPPSVISTDGSRVFFMSPDPDLDGSPVAGVGSPQLFVWQRNGGQQVSLESFTTRWLSRTTVPGQEASLMGAAFFEGASRDGDKVFFRTNSPLTIDDPNGGCGTPCTTGGPSNSSWDLYMYDLPNGPDGLQATPDGDPGGGTLTRVSRGPDGTSDCNVQTGTVRWLSEDATRVYFTCAAPLSGAATSADGTITGPGGTALSDDASNLYLHDATDTQRWTFVARLSRNGAFKNCDTLSKGRGSIIAAILGGLGNDTAIFDGTSCVRGTPDGSLVTFFTDARLTGDDPDAVTGDVYGYDARHNQLTRLSGARGRADVSYACLPGRDASPRCHGDPGIGPGGMALEMMGVARRPGVDGDRLAFFESRSQLVAEDTDASYDVYQWREGELSLLSTGVSDPDGAFYVGNDRSGTNVYIATRDQLTWQDKDRVLDVYTARIGGGIPEPPRVHPCPPLADGCRGGGPASVAPQVDSTRPGGSNASPESTRSLSLGRLSRRALRRAARTGVIRLRVRATASGRLSVSARARLGGRSRVVSRASKRVAKPGVVTVALRLNGRARAVLARGRPLRLTVRVSQRGAKWRFMTVRLRRNVK